MSLTLINLTNQDSFLFQFFPAQDRSTDRVNWQPQETTTGVKPLFYANREPRLLEFQELYFDSTETGESLTPIIDGLRSLMDETDEGGMPPPLLAVWGDRRERCVLEDLTVENVFFDEAGNPLRSKINISLLEIQPLGESSGVRIN